jgi:predicted nucleic acid-binding protein
MDSPFLGLILDSSTIIDAERKRQTVEGLLETLRARFGEVDLCISVVTIAELAHGIARAKTVEQRVRRKAFFEEVLMHVPSYPVTEASAEIAGTLGGEQAAKGITLPFADLLIGVAALEQGYAVATLNARDFEKIPGLTVVRP